MNSKVVANGSELEIIELSPTEWRVSDPHVADGDPSTVIGFIRKVGAFFEVMSMDRWRERSYFSSFRRATETLTVRHA